MTQAIGAGGATLTPLGHATGIGNDARRMLIASDETTSADREIIDRTIERLRATENGREVADFLASGRVKIKVFSDAEFSRRFPGAGAIYDPRSTDIVMPRRMLTSTSLVTVLAHEGKHAMDFGSRPHWTVQSAGLILGTIGDGAKALGRFDNPMTAWLDSLTSRQNENEVTAYHLQAKVAHELGRNESHWALGQASDGTPLPLEGVRENIATAPLYRMQPLRRLMVSATLGTSSTFFAASGIQSIARRIRPDSYLAQHSWPVLAVGGALMGAWIVGDQMRARRLAEADAQLM